MNIYLRLYNVIALGTLASVNAQIVFAFVASLVSNLLLQHRCVISANIASIRTHAGETSCGSPDEWEIGTVRVAVL